ncbi:DNA repair protein RecN [Bacillus horti]|uniref:DNA repair protein RecN n=1 Tax=Caldalkalibacillus horti TaxID=77523 RepID=A0ABT9W0R6_9BACI|nr:DNA repair protein RecN [Bacillus horti]MDQ0166866.1 DNA repair protein RecN (Recombination protein N) [Bacillus horti]
MLQELSIRNFAIIESLTVSFGQGLLVMTGETGAGKSIILDAVSLLIGGRASVDYVRHGTAKAEIEGLFDLKAGHYVFALLTELGIEAEDQTLILRRDISSQGKSICRINGKLVTLAILREIGQAIIDIHGQYEHQSLLQDENHLTMLDDFAKEDIFQHKQEYRHLFEQYKKVSSQIKQLLENEQQLAQRLDLLKFQFDEIAAAQLVPEEEEELIKEKRKHTHAQKLFKGVMASYEALQNDGGAVDSMGLALSYLQELVEYDDQLADPTEQVEAAFYQLEEAVQQLSRYQDQMEVDPERLNEIESRLQIVDQLKRKYGATISDILVYASKIEDELDSIVHKEERLDELKQKQEYILEDLLVEARNLTRVRTAIAKELEKRIKAELSGLHMDHTVISIHITPVQSGEKVELAGEARAIRAEGWDEVTIYMAPNPGEPLKPLSKIASGGELSRLMLALKSVFAKVEPVSTLIFDEVDTGVSGRVAQAMAEKLYHISKDQQVLCITHHAQLAVMADEHYRIVKEMKENTTKTSILPLNDQERIHESALMMSGGNVSSVTLKHAEELIAAANQYKKKSEN